MYIEYSDKILNHRMMNIFLSSASAFFLASGFVSGATIWINELHYENAGGDVGEFIEFIMDTSAVDIADVSLSVYNGDGLLRFTETNFIAGDILGGTFAVYSVSPNQSLQNSTEGIAINIAGTTIDFISYEGAFAATNGPAIGITSTDIGVSQPTSGIPIGSSLGLSGTGTMGGADGGDFTWTSFDAPPTNGATQGSLNSGQVLVVPEPGVPMLLGMFGFVSLLARRR